MTGELIVALNIISATALYTLSAVILWRAWSSIRQWPVSALIAILGPYLLFGIVVTQLAIWRVWGNDIPLFGWEGAGTLLLRIAIVVSAVALTRRFVLGTLLTASDRERVRDP